MRYLQILITVAIFAVSNSTYSQGCGGPVDMLCDADGDNDVDQSDIDALILAKGTAVAMGDLKDPDLDGVITTLDARECVSYCTDTVCAVPTLLGPVLPEDEVGMAPGYLTGVGYQAKEYIIADIARSYTPSLPLPSDGKLVVTADAEVVDGDYNTRLVVFRPIDAADFNGTVVVEWLNVTAGGDSNPDWLMAHNEFIRNGYAWVGVSAQAVGVNALKNSSNPVVAARYASLVHPGDSYSYDIFSLAGQLAGETASPLLGGLTADVVIADGESQSASRMVTYIDAIQPIENVFDGFFVHSRGTRGSSISQSPLPSISFPAPALIRDDLNVPVMVVQAEGDVINSNLIIRQADTPMYRAWEMAGTSHVDAYTLLGIGDPGDGSTAHTMFGFLRAPSNPFNCTNGINAGPQAYIVQAAYRGLDTWIRTGVAPPVGARLTDLSSSPVVLARDANGNALGGLRSPHVDAPLATLDSVNSAPPGGFAFCRLFGRTVPFTPARVVELYPTKFDFTQMWWDAIDASVADGFMLEVDGDDLKAAANAWSYPD
ncbi:MAG: hypothetical protein ACI9JM_002038 [Halioglobus sp.]|jgi:hypothetical protein